MMTNEKTELMDWFDDMALADCLATMRAKMCVKRHGDAALSRWFVGVEKQPENGGKNDPATYMPPRRLWSRMSLEGRMRTDKSAYNKRAIMRHVRWVVANGKLGDFEWGRRFAAFAEGIRKRVAAGEFSFERPVSFAVEKPGKDTRFVTSFQNLEDKVILRQVAMYLRARFDGLLSTNCFSFREDAKIDHTKAVKALRDYRLKHAGETLWVAECDIRKFFDVIDHGVAMKAFERLAKKVSVNPLARKALEGYLAAYTSTETLLEGAKDTSREKCTWYLAKIKDALSEVPVPIDGRRVGVPQGGAISMLIANWVLDYADRHEERKGDSDLFYARFCDDIVIVHPDKAKCRAARDRYLRALRRLLLPYHEVKNRIPYGRGFFETKSKGPYCWRASRKKTERGVSPWVSFLGNQVGVDGAVRVRQDSINRHVKALKAERRKMLWLLHVTERDGCKVALRGGAAKSDAKRKDAARAMMKSLVAKGVGYLRAGPFAAGDMCWMSAFPDVRGKDAELQLRQLDAVRARLLYPLFKMSGSKRFMGRPASYHGFLEKVERPAPGKERRAFRIGYSEL